MTSTEKHQIGIYVFDAVEEIDAIGPWEDHLQWVREQKSLVPLMTSVCTGSVVFAAAGILPGARY